MVAFCFEGYVIVSADGMLANAAHVMPDELKFEGDKRFFTAALDRAERENLTVVVYCPFPFRSNPSTFWTQHVYGARWGRLQQRWAAHRRAQYASHVVRGWDDRGVVKAVRAFCDANGAALVVKVRDKEVRTALTQASVNGAKGSFHLSVAPPP